MQTFAKFILGITSIYLAFLLIYYLAFNVPLQQSKYAVIVKNYLAKYREENLTACKFIRENVSQNYVNFNGITYPKFVQPSENKSYDFDCMNRYNNDKKKLILFWNTYFGRKDFYFGIGNGTLFKRSMCPVHNCETTNDRTRLNESSMILFHMRDNIDELPKFRRSAQRWVFVLDESQVHSSDYTIYNGLFNITSTFKRDSNLTSTYYSKANFHWKENEDFDEDFDFSAGKTECAFAIITNCGDMSGRLKYIHELRKHISVKIYGRRGEPCPKALQMGLKEIAKLIENSLAFLSTNWIHLLKGVLFLMNILPIIMDLSMDPIEVLYLIHGAFK